MKHIESIPVAKTKERESAAEAGVFWWAEYRLYREDDMWHIQSRYMCRIDNKVYARVDGKPAPFTNPDLEWHTYYSGHDPAEVVYEYVGDSNFYKATSLHPVHAAAVERLRQEREKNTKIYEAKKRAEQTAERLKTWKFEQQQLFNKRHGHKIGESYTKAFNDTKSRLKPEYDQLCAEAQEAHIAYAISKATKDKQ